jgi:hypothetical protein
MEEIGVDISGQGSKTLDRYLHEPFDHVITVCDDANEACPFFPGAANRLHWSFEDFDHALYGREVGVLGTETATGVLEVSRSEFHADGVFNKGEGDPTWAAVLAFVNVYLGGGVDPVLYLHPRFQGDLPETLTSIERRSFDPVAGSVNMVPTRRPGFMKGLSFVSV